MYKISPSDFAYLYEECKLCFYLKVKEGIGRPFSPFPAVFGAMNTLIQGNLIGKSFKTLSPKLPEGIIESQEGYIKSKQITDTNLFVSGRYDLLVKKKDGTYLLVDLKISKPSEEKAEKYKTQLASYKYAFENPQVEKPKNISGQGLLVLYPNTVEFMDDKALIDLAPTWFEVADDTKGFLKFMKEIDELLAGPHPAETPGCEWCRYRHVGETLAHQTASSEPVQEDIPF